MSDVISDSINVATNELAENENVSASVAEKIVENVENQDLKKKRSDAAKKGWLTRKNKNNLLSTTSQNASMNVPIQNPQGGPTHVIIDGTIDGDFTNKKKVAEMWDADGRLISYITKEINKRTPDKPRGTPQLDVIKQIKEDTGKIVDMMASQPPATGGSNLPPINDPPSGDGPSSRGNGNKEKDSEKALKSEYIKYLKEKYDLLIKIDALEHKQEQYACQCCHESYVKGEEVGNKAEASTLQPCKESTCSKGSSRERKAGYSKEKGSAGTH